MTFVGGPFRHQLFWLGVNRAPAGWHKWTFDFDAEAGLEIFHNDHALSAVDSGKTGLRGFSAIAVWGDQGQGHEQTVWLDDLSATLGGPVRLVSASEANPYAERATNPAASRPVIIDTRENAPAAPPLTDLPVLEKVSQYGITWTFDKPARVGHFINGDWYVVGPVTIKAIDPRPLYGGEIARRELDQMNPEQGQAVLMCPGMASGGIWRQGTGRSAIVSIMEIPQWKNRRCDRCPIL